MLIAFQIRSLLERPKVNDQARSIRMSASRFKKVGGRPFTFIGSGSPAERYDMEHPEPITLLALEVCNQLIHYYWMETFTKGRAFVSMLVFSDYKRHKEAYLFQIKDLLQLFHIFGDDSSATNGLQYQWCEKKQDYVVMKSLEKG